MGVRGRRTELRNRFAGAVARREFVSGWLGRWDWTGYFTSYSSGAAGLSPDGLVTGAILFSQQIRQSMCG